MCIIEFKKRIIVVNPFIKLTFVWSDVCVVARGNGDNDSVKQVREMWIVCKTKQKKHKDQIIFGIIYLTGLGC